jgi:hypothetical protein
MQRTSQQMNTAMKTLAYSTLALILLSFYTQGLQAQPQTYREEITVVAPYEPTISDAFKIDLRPVTGDTLPVKKSFTYEIRSGLLPTPFSPEPLKPARMVGEPLEKLYKNYLKAGFGNYLTPCNGLVKKDPHSRPTWASRVMFGISMASRPKAWM